MFGFLKRGGISRLAKQPLASQEGILELHGVRSASSSPKKL
jgi:hypothetical protein